LILASKTLGHKKSTQLFCPRCEKGFETGKSKHWRIRMGDNVSCWYGKADRTYGVYGVDHVSFETLKRLVLGDALETVLDTDADNIDHWWALCNGRYCSINADDICHVAPDKLKTSREFHFVKDAFDRYFVEKINFSDQAIRNPRLIYLPHGVLRFFAGGKPKGIIEKMLWPQELAEEQRVIVESLKANNLHNCGSDFLYFLGADEAHQKVAFHEGRNEKMAELIRERRRLERAANFLWHLPFIDKMGQWVVKKTLLPRINDLDKTLDPMWALPESPDDVSERDVMTKLQVAVLSAIRVHHPKSKLVNGADTYINQKRDLLRDLVPQLVYFTTYVCDESGECQADEKHFIFEEKDFRVANHMAGEKSGQTEWSAFKDAVYAIQSLEFYLDLADVLNWGDDAAIDDDRCIVTEEMLVAYENAPSYLQRANMLMKKIYAPALTPRQNPLFYEGLDWLIELTEMYDKLQACIDRHLEKCRENQVLVAGGECEDCKEGERPNTTRTKCLPKELSDEMYDKYRKDCERKKAIYNPRTGKCDKCLPGYEPSDSGKRCVPKKRSAVKDKPPPVRKELTAEDCAKQKMEFKDGECKPCERGTKFDDKTMKCKPKKVRGKRKKIIKKPPPPPPTTKSKDQLRKECLAKCGPKPRFKRKADAVNKQIREELIRKTRIHHECTKQCNDNYGQK
jgi:hypothetical protein